MPLSNNEYHEILVHTRRVLRDAGLGSVDERISTNLRGSDGPYYDLVFYLKHLMGEISLGSDKKLGAILRRFRDTVKTETDRPIEGIRVTLTPEEARRYETDMLDFSPNPELQEIVNDLMHLLEELDADHNRRPPNETSE